MGLPKDGGIHHLNYYGQNMAMRVPIIDVIYKSEIQKSILGKKISEGQGLYDNDIMVVRYAAESYTINCNCSLNKS